MGAGAATDSANPGSGEPKHTRVEASGPEEGDEEEEGREAQGDGPQAREAQAREEEGREAQGDGPQAREAQGDEEEGREAQGDEEEGDRAQASLRPFGSSISGPPDDGGPEARPEV